MPLPLLALICFFGGTPKRTFLLFPVVSLLAELMARGRRVSLDTRFLPLMVAGYAQYRLVGRYIRRHGLGGPNPSTPPSKLVTSGPYAYTRNPMYLGHLIFMLGLTLALCSPVALALTLVHAFWFNNRQVKRDEQRLMGRHGEAYLEYTQRVRRWIAGLP